MRPTHLALLAAILGGCGPSVEFEGEAEGGSTTGSQGTGAEETGGDEPVASSGGAGDSTGFNQPDVCPCETIVPRGVECEAPVFSFDAEPISILNTVVLSDTPQRIVPADGLVYIESVYENPDIFSGEIELRGLEGLEYLGEMPLTTGEEPKALTAVGDVLVYIVPESAESPDSLVIRALGGGGTVEISLDTVTPKFPVDLMSTSLRGAGDSLLLPLETGSTDHALNTEYLALIDVATQTVTPLPDPVAGYVPTQQGMTALRATAGDHQYCYDFSCIVQSTPTQWALTATGTDTPLADGLCVSSIAMSSRVEHAWLEGDDYFFTQRDVLQRVSPSGGATILLAGFGRIVSAVGRGRGAIVTTYADGLNTLWWVPGDGSNPRQLLVSETSHSRRNLHVGGYTDTAIVVVGPDGDGWTLSRMSAPWAQG